MAWSINSRQAGTHTWRLEANEFVINVEGNTAPAALKRFAGGLGLIGLLVGEKKAKDVALAHATADQCCIKSESSCHGAPHVTQLRNKEIAVFRSIEPKHGSQLGQSDNARSINSALPSLRGAMIGL